MMTAAEALQRWREAHGRSAANENTIPSPAPAGEGQGEGKSRIFWVALGPLQVPVPHPGQLHFHDLHHVMTGYAPDVIGEIEISAFELRTGVKTPMVFFLCIAGIALGLLIAPRRTWRAWKRGSGRRNLYGQKWSDVQHWPLSDLRSFTGI
ncbi:MAG: hypothetical protein JNM17_24715 [Archangium sp.]|nr:hypothetical protein [Archangium sp.]